MSSEFALGLAMWMGLMTQALDRPPNYEAGHFYYHDRTGAAQPLPMSNKVWLPPDEKSKNFIDSYQLHNQTEKVSEPHHPGHVITFTSKAETFAYMKRLSDKKVKFLPVVRWENMDCIPTNQIIGEVRPFVTHDLLKARLASLNSFKLQWMRLEGDKVLIGVKEPILPPNMLVLSNMLSEDTAWFSWARCVFTPLYRPISGTMTITQGTTDLGFKRVLEVTINIYKPGIKVRKDLLPKPGQNLYLPQPQKEEFWYDFDAPTITETVGADKTTIRMVYPFRYLNFGMIALPPFSVPYEDGDRKGQVDVPGVQYTNVSIIDNTSIDDLQGIAWNYRLQPLPDVPPAPPQAVPLTQIGTVVLGGGAWLLGLAILIGLIRLQRTAIAGWTASQDKAKVWNALHAAAKKCSKGDPVKWRELYMEAERRLTAVLAEFFGHQHPVASDDPSIKSKAVKLALAEIEKLYKPNAKPDLRSLAAHLLRVYNEGTDV